MANWHHAGSWYLRLREVLGRADPLYCGLCGRVIDRGLKHPHPGSYTLDMRVPRARGGQRVVENYQPAHRLCNMRKSDGRTRTKSTADNAMTITDEDEP